MATDTQLKLNVTNIRSILISGRKQEERISARKISLIKSEQQKERRLEKENKLEKIRRPTRGIPTAIGSATAGLRSGLGGFITNLLLGWLVKNLPGIVKKVQELYDEVKPIIDSGFKALGSVFDGAKYIWDKVTWLNDAIKNSGSYKIAEGIFNNIETGLENLVIFSQETATQLENALKPQQTGKSGQLPSSGGAAAMMSGGANTFSTGSGPSAQPRNSGGEILNSMQPRLQDHRDDMHRMNPIRLFPRVAEKNTKNTKHFSNNVGKFEKLLELLQIKQKSSGQSSGTSYSGNGSASSLRSSGGGSLSGMSDDDWKYLGYVVSGEAQRGTDDEYGVAASVLNRVASKDFPGTIKDVIFARNQYEAVYKGLARHEPELVEKLRSPEGQAKIIDALNKLQGRTDFKGTTQYHNYVAGEDVKFSSRGNFFHYSWQTGRNSVKPVGFADVDYQRFIKKRNLSPAVDQQQSNTQIILQPIEVEKIKYINPQQKRKGMQGQLRTTALNSKGNYHDFG